MFAEILTVGDELCRGHVLDTNSSWLAEQLWKLQVTVRWMTSCRDLLDDLRQAVYEATSRSDLVLVSGGLGPTEDDVTVDVIADLLGVDPVIDEPAKLRLEERISLLKPQQTASRFRQVRVPSGARIFVNSAGIAPGFEVHLNDTPVICMPGFPREMRAIFQDEVHHRILWLKQNRGERGEHIACRTYRVFGVGESNISSKLQGILCDIEEITIHYQVDFPEILVKLVVRNPVESEAWSKLETLDKEMHSRLGQLIYGIDEDTLAVVLGRELAKRGATMATAESCSGGIIASLLTDVPGSSAYFAGGAVTYSNAEKTRQLGVPTEIFSTHGAVSEECVKAMAQGARERFGVDYAVAVSGVAGPSGGTREKPVGTVWLAVAGPQGETTKLLTWPGNRKQIRLLAAYWALRLTLRSATDNAERETRDVH